MKTYFFLFQVGHFQIFISRKNKKFNIMARNVINLILKYFCDMLYLQEMSIVCFFIKQE